MSGAGMAAGIAAPMAMTTRARRAKMFSACMFVCLVELVGGGGD